MLVLLDNKADDNDNIILHCEVASLYSKSHILSCFYYHTACISGMSFMIWKQEHW